jgi:hypothetical protein
MTALVMGLSMFYITVEVCQGYPNLCAIVNLPKVVVPAVLPFD